MPVKKNKTYYFKTESKNLPCLITKEFTKNKDGNEAKKEQKPRDLLQVLMQSVPRRARARIIKSMEELLPLRNFILLKT